jgi:hypothetical protein
MTYKQWSDSMYGMFGRTAIIDSLDELLGEGLISREPYKMPGNKDTYKYRLNYQELNRRVRQLPERDIHDTHPKMDGYPSKNEPDASKNGRVTHPKTDAYPSKSGRNIESDIETKNLDTTERKNAEPEQKAKQQESLSSIPSEKPMNKSSFSSETKQEEKIILTEEIKQVYDLACEQLFIASPPEVTTAMKGHCAKIAKHVKNKEQMASLIAFTRKEQHLEGKTVYFGNLARGLNGWLQTQQKPVELTMANMTTATPERPRQTTNLLELYQMQQAKRKEEAAKQAAQKEGSGSGWGN